MSRRGILGRCEMPETDEWSYECSIPMIFSRVMADGRFEMVDPRVAGGRCARRMAK